MKTLFLSDIHGIYKNVHKLDQLIQQQHFELIVVLGDLYNYFLGEENNQQILNFLEKYQNKLICIKGNCDQYNSYQIEGVKKINLDGIDVYLTHGDQDSYEKRNNFTGKKGVLIYGHYHIPYIKQENEMVYICVGSISLPRDGCKASYMVYEDHKFTIYDIDHCVVKQYIYN